jgi:hypothetical protein
MSSVLVQNFSFGKTQASYFSPGEPMSFIIESRRKSFAGLRKKYGAVALVDLTSKSPEPWVRFSPFFPHGGIPVTHSPGYFSMSVEGLWQGLKVFESEGVDVKRFYVSNMKRLKRTVRKYGPVLGHQRGLDSDQLLNYKDARYEIYLPAYKWALDHKLSSEIDELKRLGEMRTVLLLDYETNTDVDNLSKPLSHAGLVKQRLEGTF